MKKRAILSLGIVLLSGIVQAETNLSWCLEYMTTNYPGSSWMLRNDCNGVGPYIKEWHSARPKPTMAEVYAVWSEAKPWKEGKLREEKADYDRWKDVPREALVAYLKVALDENNALREWMQGLKAATSNAVSLADFKLRVAALPDMPERTGEQLKQAIFNKLQQALP